MEKRNLSKCTMVGDYLLKSKLGESSVSTVGKAEHVLSGDVVVVKQVYLLKLNKHLKSCLDCEMNFLSSVNHPNIILLYNVFQDENCIFLVVEFCAGGNLSSYIQRSGEFQSRLPESFFNRLDSAQVSMLRKYVDPHYTWPQKFFNFKDMMRRLTCGVSVQFFLSFLMATHLFLGRNNAQLLQNIKAFKQLPFSQLILPGLHSD